VPQEAPGSANNKPRSAGDKSGSTSNQSRAIWEKTTYSLGMLLVRLEMIGTTYHSTIFKTHVFSLYSHLCIYRATHLHTVYLDRLQPVLESHSRYTSK